MPTTTFYATYDAAVYRDILTAETFPTIQSGVGTTESGLDSSGPRLTVAGGSAANKFTYLRRGAATFDTSVIGGGAVTAAVFSVWSYHTQLNQLSLADFAMHASGFASTPSSPYVAADFQAVANTDFGSAALPGAAGYFDITLNGSGVAAVSGAGNTYLAVRFGCDISGTFDGVWGDGLVSFALLAGLGSGDPAVYPKLTVTYTAASGTGILMGGAML